jgi:hypothetical protein
MSAPRNSSAIWGWSLRHVPLNVDSLEQHLKEMQVLTRSLGLMLTSTHLSHDVQGDLQLGIDYKPSPDCLAPYTDRIYVPRQPNPAPTATSITVQEGVE